MLLLFELPLGTLDFFAHFRFESTSEQGLEQPSQRRGELELERADDVRTVLDLPVIDVLAIGWAALEAGLEPRQGVRDSVGG